MSIRLSIIATRTGDAGTTGLGDNSRVDKDAPRITAMGEVDELNSMIGLLRTEPLPKAIDALLARIQNDLFDLGAELCIPGHTALTTAHVLFLDEALKQYNATLSPLKEFILPGGTRSAALAHMARTICRRAERAVITLDRTEKTALEKLPSENTEKAPPTTENSEAPQRNVLPAEQANGSSTLPASHASSNNVPNTINAINAPVKQYLNRLSDLCFVLARTLNQAENRSDVLWGRDA